MGKARGRARAKLATSKVVLRKALEGERGESHLISIGRLVYVPVAVPRVDAVMRYHQPVVGPLLLMFPAAYSARPTGASVTGKAIFRQGIINLEYYVIL